MGASLRGEAIEKFYASRNKADLVYWLGKLAHRCVGLMSLQDLMQRPAACNRRDIGVQFVPIRQIVASVDRQDDFTRSFLPRAGASSERWVRLYEALSGLEGFPEVELLRIGDRYAVLDGHHRISVAHAAGLQEIAAHVTEVTNS